MGGSATFSWWQSAKQWARDTWREATAPSPLDPAENKLDTRRSIHVMIEACEDMAGQAEMHDVWRLLRQCRAAIQQGRERSAADALQSVLVAYRSSKTRETGETVETTHKTYKTPRESYDKGDLW